MFSAVRSEIMPPVTEYVRDGDVETFDDVLRDVGAPHLQLIAALLMACGNRVVHYSNEADANIFVFEAGVTSSAVEFKGTFDRAKHIYKGPSHKLLGEAFQALAAYERELETAAMLPPEIRSRRIAMACKDRKIEIDFFKFVTSNLWR